MDVITETPRMVLRRFTADDLDDATALLSHPEVMRFSLGAKNRAEVEAWLERCFRTYDERGWGPWAVVFKGDGQMIGFCGLLPQVIDGVDEVEIGYRLLPEYWGQGLGTEAARAVRRHAWSQLGLDRLISIVEPDNVASIRVAEKHGMQLEKETVAWGRQVQIYSIDKAGAR